MPNGNYIWRKPFARSGVGTTGYRFNRLLPVTGIYQGRKELPSPRRTETI